MALLVPVFSLQQQLLCCCWWWRYWWSSNADADRSPSKYRAASFPLHAVYICAPELMVGPPLPQLRRVIRPRLLQQGLAAEGQECGVHHQLHDSKV
jgi:hypothetical protein